MKYRRKPGEVEAVQWLGNIDEITAFVGKGYSIAGSLLYVDCPGGYIIVSPGDYVIRDGGEYYTCDPGVFTKKYEAVDEDALVDQRQKS